MSLPVGSRDARTQDVVETVTTETQVAEVRARCASAARAAGWLSGLGLEQRARLLESIAEALEADSDRIVELADRETALGEVRLRGELARTTGQLGLFAEVVRDGEFLGLTVESADSAARPPRPDLYRMRVPLGPVAVFGASNFPLAFSVPGGDTASALAAGCPVVVKAHPAHPATSLACFEAMRSAVVGHGGPEGLLGLVYGYEAGTALVADPNVRAVGFTGSVTGGRALFEIAVSRPDPIPFYGELGSLNPLVVTHSAARARGADIGAGCADSVLLGLGQFCTKPGIVFVPDGEAGGGLVRAMVARMDAAPGGTLLTEGIRDALRSTVREARAHPEVEVLVDQVGADASPDVGAVLLRVGAARLRELPLLREEHFGPFAVVVTYSSTAELLDTLRAGDPALTATLHAEGESDPLADPLLRVLRERAGRVVWNGYPTGVAVSWAMTHGGPHPATTSSLHTSVGAAAIERFLRPITYQSVPEPLLPVELRANSLATLPHRRDGKRILP